MKIYTGETSSCVHLSGTLKNKFYILHRKIYKLGSTQAKLLYTQGTFDVSLCIIFMHGLTGVGSQVGGRQVPLVKPAVVVCSIKLQDMVRVELHSAACYFRINVLVQQHGSLTGTTAQNILFHNRFL